MRVMLSVGRVSFLILFVGAAMGIAARHDNLVPTANNTTPAAAFRCGIGICLPCCCLDLTPALILRQKLHPLMSFGIAGHDTTSGAVCCKVIVMAWRVWRISCACERALVWS